MPPPDDPRPPPRRWPVVVALVGALALTAVVATTVVLGTRPPQQAAPAVTVSASARVTSRPAPAPGSVAPATPVASPSASPSGTPPAASPTPSAPTAAPQAPQPTSSDVPTVPPGPDRSLKTNSLYGLDLSASAVACDLRVRRPKPALPDAKLEAYLTTVAACVTKAFKGPLATEGFTLVQPSVKTYHKRVESPCGTFGQSGSPAYYCSTTRTIYWPDTVDDGREAYTFARLGYVGLTAHEFGHHLQATTGMLGAYAEAYDKASKKDRYALSRRLELQAQCFEGVFLHVTRTDLGVSAKDRTELKAWHSYTGDEDPPDDRKPDHGTSKAQFAWLERGLDSGDLGDCNTWTASARSVT